MLYLPVAAALIAAVYRFPIPFAGYEGGLHGAGRAALASLFYLFLGGAVVVGVLGAAAGVIAGDLLRGPRRNPLLWIAVVFLPPLVAALLLAVLDKLIGPW